MSSKIPKITFVAVIIAAVVAGIEPRYRLLWLIENILVAAALPALAVMHRKHPFSDPACVAMGVFFLLHLVGAHWGYNEFPLFEDYRSWGWSRNHYDRIVHFAFGLLVVITCHEWLTQRTKSSALLARYLAVSEIMGMSMVYELIEWCYAVSSNSDAGPMFLGAQGDPWDAHKDMALALLGAALTMMVGALRDAVRHPAAQA